MNNKAIDMIGTHSPGSRASSRLVVEVTDSWLSRIGCLSLVAGAASVIACQPSEVWAQELNNGSGIPPRIAKKSKIIAELNANCTKPELLRRQSEYRLPHQKASFDMLRLLAGNDSCPGRQIPAGTYTAAAPYTDSGDTTGANNTVANENCTYCYYCYFDSEAGPDHIYTFTLTARGPNPQIQVSTASTTYNPSIYVLNGLTGERCPIGTGNYASNCLTAASSAGIGGTETIVSSEMNRLPLNVPLHLVVDASFVSNANNSGPYTIKLQDVTVAESANPPSNDAPLDMNGDGRSDFVVVRNTGGGQSGQMTWYTRTSNDTFPSPFNWGIATDKFVPADYDGDGKDDFAIWRPGAQGIFFILLSRTQTLHIENFGQTGDDPTIVADYTGDGIDDVAVYRPGAPSNWYFRPLGAPFFTTVPWGQTGDTPFRGDFNFDHRADFVVRRPEGPNGRLLFFFKFPDSSATFSMLFGLANDRIVTGDFAGNGYTDLAVVRPGTGGIFTWDIARGLDFENPVHRFWGVSATDIVATGDYDGDGRTEMVVWRPGSPGIFFQLDPFTGQIRETSWGQTGDYPVANYQAH
jgi:hypothetical protein